MYGVNLDWNISKDWYLKLIFFVISSCHCLSKTTFVFKEFTYYRYFHDLQNFSRGVKFKGIFLICFQKIIRPNGLQLKRVIDLFSMWK